MKKLLILLMLTFVFSFSEKTSAEEPKNTSLADTPWPMYQHDPQHTGRSPFIGPLQNPVLLWTYQMPARINGFPGPLSITTEGNIITPSGGTLQSIDPIRHSVNWTFAIGGHSNQTPLSGADGSIYWGKALELYKLTSMGEKVWTVYIESYNWAFDGSPTFGNDGNIYFVHDGIFSASPDGFPRWWYWYPYDSNGKVPAIGFDGTIYAPGLYDLAAYTSSGDIKWSIITPQETRHSNAMIGDDGTIYIPSDGSIYAINSDSTIRWEFKVPAEDFNGNMIIGTALAPDGTIFGLMYRAAPDDNSILYAVNKNGQMKWKAAFDSNIITGWKGISNLPLLTDRDGNVFLCLYNSRCYGFRSDGSKLWELNLPLVDSIEVLPQEPVLAADGLIYVTDNNTRLYAYADPGIYPTLMTSIKELSYDVRLGTSAFTATIPVTSTMIPLTYTVSITPTNWLNASFEPATTPSTVSLQIDPSSLSPGKYKGSMMIKTSGRVGSWIEIPIKLSVTTSMDYGYKIFLPVITKAPGDIITYPGPYRILYQRQYFLVQQLVTIDSEGEKLEVLANNLPQMNQIAVSPDGSKIALGLVNEKNQLFIWVLDGVTGNKILEIQNGNMNRSPIFSPKGDQLLFISNMDHDQGELYRINIDGSNLKRLTNNSWQETGFFWSPQGDKIAVGINWFMIYIMNPDGTDSHLVEQVFPNQELMGWSPDGYKILMSVIKDNNSSRELWFYDLLNHRTQYIDNGVKQDSQAAWSPDGKMIAYIKGSYDNWYLYGFELASGKSHQIVGPISQGSTEDPFWSWSPDSKQIAISKPRGSGSANNDIFIVSPNGTNLNVLTTNIKNDRMPYWLPEK